MKNLRRFSPAAVFSIECTSTSSLAAMSLPYSSPRRTVQTFSPAVAGRLSRQRSSTQDTGLGQPVSVITSELPVTLGQNFQFSEGLWSRATVMLVTDGWSRPA